MAMERYEEPQLPASISGDEKIALAPDSSLYSPPGKPDIRDQGTLQKAVDHEIEHSKNANARENHAKIDATPAEKQVPDSTESTAEEKAFYGIDTPFLKLGFSDWSFKFGADIGVAKFGTSLGKDTGVEGGAGLPGLVFADGHAGVGFNENGMNGRVGAQADLLKQSAIGIGGGAGGRFSIGTTTGATVDQNARALGLHQSLRTGAEIGSQGLNAGYDVNAGIAHTAGVKNNLGLSLGPDSYIEKNVGLYAGTANLGAGAGIDSGGNEFFRPNVHVEGGLGADKGRADLGAQIGPGADVSLGAGYDHIDLANQTEQGKEAVASAGLSGVGAKVTDVSDGEKFAAGKVGFGEKYAAKQDNTVNQENLDAHNAYRMVEADRAEREEREQALTDESARKEAEPLHSPHEKESTQKLLPDVRLMDRCEIEEDLQPIQIEFSRGATVYDIARMELVGRSRYTGEAVDNDSIFRECNRIMVNSGFPDAHLEGKTNITKANLPKAWNAIRNGQVLTIYSAEELNGIARR